MNRLVPYSSSSDDDDSDNNDTETLGYLQSDDELLDISPETINLSE